MPLGRQFRNTFWNDDEGNVKAAEESRGLPGEPAGSRPEIYDLKPGDKTEHHLQGMMFSPYVGTGLRQDPMINSEKRRQTIKDSLGLFDTDDYRRRVASMIPGQAKRVYDRESKRTTLQPSMGRKKAEEGIGLITDALDRTDMPTHLIEKTVAGTVLDPRAGRAYAEDYSGRVRLTTNFKTKWETTGGETVTRPVVKPGAPIINKSFHNAMSRIDWGSEEGAHADMAGSGAHFVHAQTGEPLHLDSELRDSQHDFRDPEVRANVWPGAGKDTDKVLTHTFKVYNGMGDRGERERTFHTRHEAVHTGETETVTTPSKTTVTKTPTTSSTTLVHELGHVRDPNTADPFSHRLALRHKADPVEEGIADAHADRFVRHAGQYEETLHPSAPGRMQEIQHGGGYGVDYHHWKSNAVAKALYVATRTHAAMDDSGASDIPSRKDIGKQFSVAAPGAYDFDTSETKSKVQSVDRLLLGQMYDAHPHVRQALHDAGLSKVAAAAHAHYTEQMKALQPQRPQHEQMELPMEIPKDPEIEGLFTPRKKGK